MSNSRWPVIHWFAKVLALAFVALTAFGWWDESQARQEPSLVADKDWLWQWAVTTHLIPLVVILIGTVLGWTKPLSGGIAFVIFAAIQAVFAGAEFIYWPYLVLPPALIAAFYFLATPKAKNR